MKIRGQNGRPSPPGEVSSVPASDKKLAPPLASAATDQMQLSSLAQAAASNDDSPTHIVKLSSLSATVLSGGYRVAAGALSNSIIEASIHLSGGN